MPMLRMLRALGRNRDGRRWPLGMLGVLAGGLLAGCGLVGGPAAAAPTPTLIPLPPLDPAVVAAGRQVYLQHCATCHGANAQGAPNWQRPNAQGDMPAPPHDDSGHTWRHSDAELTAIILHGLRDPFNKTPGLTMPPFTGVLTPQQIAAVITYFKSLWSPAHRRYQEEQNLNPTSTMPRMPGPTGTPTTVTPRSTESVP